MKKRWMTWLVILMAGCWPAAGEPAGTPAFVSPTAEQIQAVAENPLQLTLVLADATSAQAVDVFVKVLDQIKKLKLSREQKEARVAVLTGTLFRALPKNAGQLAGLLAKAVGSLDMLPKMAAAAAVVVGVDRASGVTESFAMLLPPAVAAAVRQAGEYPASVLPPDTIMALGSQVAGPPPGAPIVGREPTAVPVAPPLRPEQEGGGGGGVPPPAPAPRYSGQQE
jgi:hypothetical protein